ncbi:hypothetical protein D9611_012987 [Ephemerocybe angulata]|uniref:Uncharacterized protein n=1 Tax=Ephemerocybe angulata TaxID=980116 RepID=A0A8H5AW25_9AGAR|nr:hypothetical protein D9611_012987 [Tulosesus angulatus]
MSTLAASAQRCHCAIPGVQTPQSHPNSLHPRTHSHHQAQLIKPLAGSISVVISRSRHRNGCKTTDHSRAAMRPIGIFPPSVILRVIIRKLTLRRRSPPDIPLPRGAIPTQCQFHTITRRHITLGTAYHQGRLRDHRRCGAANGPAHFIIPASRVRRPLF